MRLCCSLVLAIQAVAFQPPGGLPAGVVEGRVVDSATGAPLAAVRVTLAQIPIVMGIRPTSGVLGEDFYDPSLMPAQRVAQAPPAVVISGADGQFRITLNPGRYQVRAERQGFFVTPAGLSSLSLIPGERLKGVTIKLTQYAVISGRVVDADGQPMGAVRVQAMRWTIGGAGSQRVFAAQSSSGTDDRGEYRLAGLTPGKYILSAEATVSGPAKSAFVMQFAPGVTDPVAAQTIDLAPGNTRPGVDIRLRRVPVVTVRGKVTLPDSVVTPGSEVMVALLARNPAPVTAPVAPAQFTQANADGSFLLRNVPPGAYVVSASHVSGAAQVRLVGRANVDVAESEVSGIAVALRAGVVLEGRVRMAGGVAGSPEVLNSVSLWLQPPAGSFSGTAHSAVGQTFLCSI